MSILEYAFALIVAISLLVAIHEYGHYIVARMCGIKVLRFSVGFGKPVWSRRAGADNTEYCISALPLGGYVKMLDEREGEVSEADRGRSFNAQPVWQRIAVLLAGPFFNFFFAIFAYWVVFVAGTDVTRPYVGVVEPNTPAAEAGLQHGDRIVSVGDTPIDSWQAGLQTVIAEMVDDAKLPLTVRSQDGSSRDVVLALSRETARLSDPGSLWQGLGFKPWAARPIVGDVSLGSPAAQGGLLRGDVITRVGGTEVESFTAIVRAIRATGEQAVMVDVMRAGQPASFTIKPRMEVVDGRRIARVGIAAADIRPDDLYTKRGYGLLGAIPEAVRETGEKIGFTLDMFGRMLTGSVSTKNISGPISIAEFAGDTLDRGLIEFVGFLALISVSLGVLNLLPVPMLDGGQIVYQVVEGVTGKPLSEKWQIAGQQVGILMLFGLMSLAFYNDIARLVGQVFT